MSTRLITEAQLTAFETYLMEEEKSPATVAKYLRDVRHLCRHLDETMTINKHCLLDYKAYLEKAYAIRSANSMLASINAFFRYMQWEELRIKPFRVQRDVYCSEEKELSREEYDRLIQTAQQKKQERLSLVIQTICATGIRVSELTYITVEAVRRGEATVSCKGKIRKIFIVKKLRRKLLQYAAQRGIDAGKIFVTKSGKALDRSNIWREMKQLCQATGISMQKVFPHNLRHLFARTFYAMDKDMAKLADILGHSNVNTTRIYILTTGYEHRQRMERMHLIL